MYYFPMLFSWEKSSNAKIVTVLCTNQGMLQPCPWGTGPQRQQLQAEMNLEGNPGTWVPLDKAQEMEGGGLEGNTFSRAKQG